MADGSVKIDITADDSDIKKKLSETEEGFDGLGEKQKETQKETEKTANKYKELTETIEKQEKGIAELREEYVQAAVNFGENSKEAQSLKEKFSSLNDELTENKKKLKNAADGLDDLGDSAKKPEKGFKLLDGVISSFVGTSLNDLAGKALEIIGNLAALSEETREYREDMAKLEAGFKSAGHSTETAQKAYDGFYKLLGESDRSVEAVNHLAELTTNTEEVAKWTDIAAGVTAKFGDSLPIEGLTEAANETAKVGAVTGPLADALNWAGISEDAFNEKLAACNSEQERATLITNTLSAEYQAAAAEYNALTASTQAAREATNRMEQAQANLGAAMEPLTTAWTNIKASALEWTADAFSAAESTDILTESQRAGVTAAHEAAEAYRETKTAVHEMALAQVSDVDYATNYLLPQLQEIVDANGNVKQGYEERAAFILGQMNSAWGTEYTRVSEIIGKNGELKQSVLDVIEAKKAQILLSAQEEDYKKAVENVTAAEKAWIEQAQAKAKAYEDVKAAEEELTRVMEEEKDERGIMAGLDTANAQANLAEKKRILEEQTEAYNLADADIKGYYADIDSYQHASTLLMEGKTAEAISYLNNLSAGYKTTTGNVQSSTEEQMAILEQQAIDTGVKAVLMRENYEKGVAGVTEAMVKTAEEAAATAKTEFEKIGGQIGDGIGVGAESKKPGLITKIKNIVAALKRAAEEEADINSPAKEFAWIGEMLMAGLEQGIDENAEKPIEATETVMNKMKELAEDRARQQIKTIAACNDECNQEIAKHNEERLKLDENVTAKLIEIDEKYAEDKAAKNKQLVKLDEKLAEDKKRKGADLAKLDKEYKEQKAELNADLLKLEKDYNKNVLKVNTEYDLAVERENERHVQALEKIEEEKHDIISSKMQELVTLGETYKENTKKLWEELEKSVTDLQANYDNQLASRTKSIADSLNLWSEATKNAPSIHTLTNNLKSQVSVLESYNEAIATLESRNVSEAFIQQLKELGVGSTGEIQTIARMTDKQLEKYVALWEEKNELARNAALEELEPLKAETETKIQELTDAAMLKYAEMRAKFKEDGALLAEELKQDMIAAGLAGYEEIQGQIDTYTEAGADLMDGVVLGVVKQSPILSEAVTTAVNRAIAAAKAAAGIASPSKVMKKEVGANLAEGVKVGWADKIANIKDKMAIDMQGITTRIKAVVSAENARMAQGVGVRDTGFTEVAQAVGMQTAGINSLASEYRKGSNTQITVPLILDSRELGHAIIDLGSIESERLGTNVVFG